MFDLAAVQSALRQFGLDGWLLAEFRGSNVLARRVLASAWAGAKPPAWTPLEDSPTTTSPASMIAPGIVPVPVEIVQSA